MKNADVVSLPIAQIRLDGGTQPRTALDFAAIDDYAEAMAAGGKFPPVVVFHDGEHYWLADGFHRLKAAFAAGFDAIDCELRQGTLEDAQWYSFSANKTNGLRRTNEDKQRAVKSALLHARAASMSNYAIARHVGVDEATVRNWRSKLAASTEIPQIDTRTVSRHGTTYQQRTTQIGRRRVAKISTPDGEPAELAQVPPYLDNLLRAAAALADCEVGPAGFAREILARPDRAQILAQMEKAHEFLAFCLAEIRRSHAAACDAFAPPHADDGDARARQTVA
ncbi:MAG TPA: ParB/RepB/Spo0J family partition protein [Bryobacteraceae bacterium]|nr:ParB/RepB/Spo0J family partition protein [Bryobacteraceae bacterium]